jgi:hypothetical protein
MIATMKQPKASDCTRRTPGAPPTPLPELPAWKAFVVQFSRESGAHGEGFAGRVEHLSSGRRVRFASAQELLTSLEKLLAEVGLTADEKPGAE